MKLFGFEVGPMPVWKWIVGVLAAIVAVPFMLMAVGITVVLLAPFAIPALPVMAFTLFTKERPAITPVGRRLPVPLRRRVFAT